MLGVTVDTRDMVIGSYSSSGVGELLRSCDLVCMISDHVVWHLIHIATYVTGFWKANQIVTLGQFYFICPANGYTHTLHIHSAITSLVNWSTFLEQPCEFTTETMGLMGVLHGRHGSEIHPSDGETSLTPFQACLGLWLALLGPIASPNSPNGRFNPPLASYPPLHLPLPSPTHPPL